METAVEVVTIWTTLVETTTQAVPAYCLPVLGQRGSKTCHLFSTASWYPESNFLLWVLAAPFTQQSTKHMFSSPPILHSARMPSSKGSHSHSLKGTNLNNMIGISHNYCSFDQHMLTHALIIKITIIIPHTLTNTVNTCIYMNNNSKYSICDSCWQFILLQPSYV